MSKGIRFTDEFKQDALAQVVEVGYAVSEVADRLGFSTKSLYTWKSQFANSPHVMTEASEQEAEIKRLKRDLATSNINFRRLRATHFWLQLRTMQAAFDRQAIIIGSRWASRLTMKSL